MERNTAPFAICLSLSLNTCGLLGLFTYEWKEVEEVKMFLSEEGTQWRGGGSSGHPSTHKKTEIWIFGIEIGETVLLTNFNKPKTRNVIFFFF